MGELDETGPVHDPNTTGARAVVRRSAAPAPTDDPRLSSRQREATVPWFKKVYYLLRGYAVEDIRVLHEAAVRAGVVRAEQQMAAAENAYAEADERRANAERARAEARKLRAEAEATEAAAAVQFALVEHTARQAALALEAGRGDDVPGGGPDPGSPLQPDVEEAVRRLREAIALVRSKGGDVYVSEDQIREALRALGEDPDS